MSAQHPMDQDHGELIRSDGPRPLQGGGNELPDDPAPRGHAAATPDGEKELPNVKAGLPDRLVAGPAGTPTLDVLLSVRRRKDATDRLEREAAPFPFLDRSRCWDPREFFEENMRLIEQGFRGKELEDRLACWLGDGRVALFSNDRQTRLVMRQVEEDVLIRYRFYRPQDFPFCAVLPKSDSEMVVERRRLARRLGLPLPPAAADELYPDSSSDNEGEEEEEEESPKKDESRHHQHGGEAEKQERDGAGKEVVAREESCLEVSPLKDVPLYDLLRRSIWARWFDRIVFDPSIMATRSVLPAEGSYDPFSPDARILNVFTGFRWSPEELDAMALEWDPEEVMRRVRLIAVHVVQIACRGDPAKADYVLKYFKSIYVRPWEPMQTMILLVGTQGCGKTAFMKIFGPIFGAHYRYVSDLNDLVGDFTATAKEAVLAFVDEAKVRHESRAAAKLKTAISECDGALRVREMRKDVVYENSYLNVVGAIDNLDDFQVNLRGRRFNPLHFSDDKVGKKDYFDALHKAIKDDDYLGLRGFLHLMLRTVDITDFGRGQVVSNREDSLRTIADEMRPFDPFEDWLRKLVDRGYTVRNLDDNNGLNDGIGWLDPYGRTPDTRDQGWVCEVAADALYRQFRADTGLHRMRDAEVRRGLARWLRPACLDPPVRRAVRYEARENGEVKLRRTPKRAYLTLLRWEDYAELLGLVPDRDEAGATEETTAAPASSANPPEVPSRQQSTEGDLHRATKRRREEPEEGDEKEVRQIRYSQIISALESGKVPAAQEEIREAHSQRAEELASMYRDAAASFAEHVRESAEKRGKPQDRRDFGNECDQ